MEVSYSRNIRPDILVIDDEAAGLRELVDAADRLGFYYHLASGAEDALSRLRHLPKVGVIVTDINMPGIDGLTMLRLLQSSNASVIPEAIVVTGDPDMEKAVEALRLSVSDFLKKPIKLAEFAAALSRAAKRWRERQELSSAISQIPPEEPGGVRQSAESQVFPGQRRTVGSVTPNADFLKDIVRFRDERDRLLGPLKFSDPDWDILLDLAVAGVEGRKTTVTNLCAATNVSYATAFRRIEKLVNSGTLVRTPDPLDQRRIFVDLSPETRAAMFELIEKFATEASDVQARSATPTNRQ